MNAFFISFSTLTFKPPRPLTNNIMFHWTLFSHLTSFLFVFHFSHFLVVMGDGSPDDALHHTHALSHTLHARFPSQVFIFSLGVVLYDDVLFCRAAEPDVSRAQSTSLSGEKYFLKKSEKNFQPREFGI